eukprot:2130487-Pyramimonas_sp.AAC.1
MFAPGKRRSKAERSSTKGGGPPAAEADGMLGKVEPMAAEGAEGAAGAKRDSPWRRAGPLQGRNGPAGAPRAYHRETAQPRSAALRQR